MSRIAVAGASGRMGRLLIEAVAGAKDLELVAALDHETSPAVGTSVAGGIVVTADVASALAEADVLIDFTRPDATRRHLQACLRSRVRLVIGTTGFDAEARREIEAAGRDIALVCAPNMDIGVNVVFRLLEDAARALGPDYDVEIIEAHHRLKVDAPSGTALRMGEIVADARGTTLAAAAVHDRHGDTGAREKGTIGFTAIRGGDIVGDHTVLFAGDGERIEITHRSTTRQGYVAGSLAAARFVVARERGVFDMQDVLGLRRRA